MLGGSSYLWQEDVLVALTSHSTIPSFGKHPLESVSTWNPPGKDLWWIWGTLHPFGYTASLSLQVLAGLVAGSRSVSP